MYYDAGALSINASPLLRYAEVLLTYAEAHAELGTLNDLEWASTIGVLRVRGGITGGLSVLPTVVDPYLEETYFPQNSADDVSVTSPVILEIRRERGIELSLEGLRYSDLLRWKR